jgi:hypothetical protein
MMLIVSPPVLRADSSQEAYPRYIAQVRQALQHFTDSRSQALFIMAEPLILDEEELFDAIHPKQSGAKRYTQAFFEELKKAFNSQGRPL